MPRLHPNMLLVLLAALLVGCGGPAPQPTAEAATSSALQKATPAAPAASPQASPTPLPQPEPETPLLYDDFSQLTSGWTPLTIDAQGTVKGYSAQGYAFSTTSADQLLYDLLPQPAFAPRRYAVDIELVEGKGVFGLLLEARGNASDYAGLAYYGVGLTAGGDAVVFQKAAGGDLQILQVAEHASEALGAGKVVRLAVDRSETSWVVAVGERQVLSVEIGAAEPGTVGFFARAVDRLAVRFDNLLLSAATPSEQPTCAALRPLFDRTESGDLITGQDVRIAQRRLRQLGYDPGADSSSYSLGIAGAVQAFQQHNGLTANGVLNGPTWCRLLNSAARLADGDQSERTANQARYRAIPIDTAAGLTSPLLLSVRDEQKLWQIALALPGRSSVHYIDTGGDAYDPAWQVKKGLLAFTSMRGGNDQESVWLLDTTSGEVRQISPLELEGQFPTWSADGSQLMFSAVPPAGADKAARNYIYTPTDGTLRVWSSEQAGWADWSRFDMIAVTRLTGYSFDIFVANADGSNTVNLTNSDDAHEDVAAWSPDGGLIAFVRNPKSDSNQRQVFVMQPDGSEVRQLTSLAGPNSNPVWLDSTTLAFIHQSSLADRQIYLLRLNGELRQLSRNEGRVWFLGQVDGR